MDTSEIMALVILIGGLYAMVAFIAQVLSTNSTRRRLAEHDLAPDQVEALMRGTTDVPGALKLGVVTITIGIALVVVHFLPENLQDQPIAFALIFLFAGSGFLIYHRIARKHD